MTPVSTRFKSGFCHSGDHGRCLVYGPSKSSPTGSVRCKCVCHTRAEVLATPNEKLLAAT